MGLGRGGVGVPAGRREAAGSGSGGSAEESSEEDVSEEGFGQAEEEVAALLVRLGKTDTYFQGFSDADDDVREARLSAGHDANVNANSRAVAQEQWGIVGGGMHGGGGERRYS